MSRFSLLLQTCCGVGMHDARRLPTLCLVALKCLARCCPHGNGHMAWPLCRYLGEASAAHAANASLYEASAALYADRKYGWLPAPCDQPMAAVCEMSPEAIPCKGPPALPPPPPSPPPPPIPPADPNCEWLLPHLLPHLLACCPQAPAAAFHARLACLPCTRLHS